MEKPIEKGDTMEGKSGTQYYECTVLDVDESALKARWLGGTEAVISRAAMRRKSGASGQP